MRPERTSLRLLLAVLSVGALGLAACGPQQETAAESADPEPATDEPSADEQAVEDAAGTGAPEAPEDDAEQAAEGAADEPVAGGEVTAYVVAYHWGFAIFDEEGAELERLQAPKGATVELVAVNDHAREAIAQLPAPVVETIGAISWHERVHHDMEMGRIPDPQVETGASLEEMLSAAHDGHDHEGPTQDHGLMVTGVGARTILDAHAREPEHLVFTVDEEGTFEFRCTEDCGFGHDYQRWELLVVEA